jgi:hypothetical protein
MPTNAEMMNMTRVQKADLSLAYLVGAGGALNQEQAEKFVRLAMLKSTVMSKMTAVPMRASERKLPTIKFGSRILTKGASGEVVPSGSQARPSFTYPVLTAKLFKAMVPVEDEVFEDNIEGESIKNTLMQLITDAIARDVEEIVLAGDTTHTTDETLAVLDGVIAQATSHLVDASGVRLSRTLLKALYKALPSQYKDDDKSMVIWTGTTSATDYRDDLADRATVLGDQMAVEFGQLKYQGIGVDKVPLVPETMGITANRTVALLMNPKNATIGWHKKVEIALDQNKLSGEMYFIVRTRFDVKLADPDGVSKVYSILAT